MATEGNPSALHFVFAAEEFSTKWWQTIRQNRDSFASRLHLIPFIKFADDQMDRLLGRKGQKNIHRAALEELHGYDTKYAMLVIRLYLEAKEYMETGRISLPNPRVELLVAIRRGKYKLSEIEAMEKELQAETYSAQKTSPLPDAVNQEAVTKLITEVYLDFWNSKTE
jgi:RNA repair pathway DNA polymerase beta family